MFKFNPVVYNVKLKLVSQYIKYTNVILVHIACRTIIIYQYMYFTGLQNDFWKTLPTLF